MEKKDEILYRQKNAYELMDEAEKKAVYDYSERYKAFLSRAKTERLAVKEAIKLAEQHGFRPFDPASPLKKGDKVYLNNRGKALMLAVIGKKTLDSGAHIAAAHIDSPRLDLKALPLYEDGELAYFKTHYYGGIKKYQWVTIPLELHGVVYRKDGTAAEVSIGAEPGEPQLVITDLLPHLGADQMKKSMAEGIKGEALNLLIGSVPVGEGDEKVKYGIMKILSEKYAITEEDFLSAELEAVPAFDARDIGLDRSLIGGYGHDDRVCAYAELEAILETEKPEITAVCILADKEEIGSEGVTGMQSQAFENFMGDLCDKQKVKLEHCFANSFCISADVCNGYDPVYPEVSEKRNNAKLNYGVGICKYTGARGKSGSSDASAEVVSKLRAMFAAKNVIWQMAELGKVDQGGGGTVAVYMAKRNIDTIDAGVPVLSMHAPFEVVAKADCYMTFKGVKAMYEAK